MRNKKLLVVAIFVAMSLVACGLVLFLTADKECNHEWLDATCSAPKTCKLCQATEGEAQHEWLDATCTEPKHCKNCSKTEGTALGHTGGVADCVSGAECTRCGEEYGEAGAHAYNQQAVKPEALKSAATCQSAAVYYKSCACGLVSTNENDTFTFGDALAHTFDREVANENTLKTEATCQSAAIYYKSCACGAVSESNLDVFTAGELGAHVYDQINVNAAALKTPATCQNAAVYYKSCICGAVSSNDADVFEDGDTADHRYTLVGSTTATCTHSATNTYRCDVCGDEYTDDVGMALGHDTSGVTPVEKAVEGSTCKFVLVYTCKRAGCGAEVEEGTIERHNYIARITKEATCAEDGVKTYTCICGDSYTEVIPKNETSHNWIKGVVTLGTRTDTCSVCGATKSVTVYEGNKTESTNTNDLKDKEIEINDANINLGGDVLDAIGDKEVTISADKLEGDDKLDLGLSKDQLSQVGDNPIYNFTINDGSENISQFGEDNYVTITLPYTLSDGEDVDSIAIWFINDDGELETIKATYSNGYVTFKTNHFSYYTVTRLTPAERCALYGHSYTKQTQEANCTKAGYDLYFCVRCHDQYKDNEVEALGHKFVEVRTEPTCTKAGNITYTCEHCNYSYKTRLSATGHNYVSIENVDATCIANGYEKFECDGCGKTYTTNKNKISHEIEQIIVEATCDREGHTLNKCKNCDYSYANNYTASLGHDYALEGWTWTEDYSSATLKFVCRHDESHTVTREANISVSITRSPCSEFYIKTVYTATVLYNGQMYEDTKETEKGSASHVFGAEWKFDDKEHWHECACGEKADVTEHTFENETVTKEPTCEENGEKTAYCSCGAEHKTEIEALGHDFVEDEIKESTCAEEGYTKYVCSDCGEEKIDKIEKIDHDITDTVVDPTCTEGGYTLHECKNCDYSVKDSETAPVGHSYIPNVTAPTCTEKGYTTYTCVCGESYVDEYVDMIPHNFVEEERKDSTCAEEGFIKYGCSACDEEKVEALPMLAHDIVDTVVEPTCTEGGYTLHECKNCDYSVKDSETKPVDHKYDATVTAPTCTAKGYTTYTCACGDSYVDDYVDMIPHNFVEESREDSTCAAEGFIKYGCSACNGEKVEALPKIAHDIADTVVDPTCTEDGYTLHECKNCDYSVKDSETKATGHKYTDVVTVPTCTEKGYTTHTCACGESYVDSYVKETGHKYADVVTAPTCTEKGFTTHTCACGETYVDSYVEATGHTESDWIVDEQATTEAEGSKHIECTVCKETLKTEKIPVVIEGLEFALNSDKKSYSVVGIGTYKGTEIVIPETHEGLPVTAIGKDAFSNNKKITSVVIPSSVTLIGENAFKNCDGIVEVKLPNGVVTISDNAFFACKALKNIEIPNSVTSIGVMAFSNCGALEYIHFIGNENEWNAIEKGKDWDKGAGKHVIDFEFEVIVPHEHKYNVVVTAPTCTAKGYTTYTCECGESYVDNYVDATGHDYEAVVTAPTCTEKGYTTYTCACGDTYVDTYVDPAHSYEVVVTAPTCTERGYTTYTCACGNSYVGDYVEATGHDYKAVVTAPTCTEKGYTTYTCACGDTYVGDYVEATGHIYVDGVCSGCGRGENDCDHTELHEEKIDLSEYGTCEFYFTIATCECGEVKYLVDAGDSECDLENGETEYIYNDNGQIIGMRVTTSCSACGITIYAEMFQEVNGCIETTVINYVFSIDEEVILDGLSMRENHVRHSYEKAEIDLSKYDGCCGGTLYVSMCKDCGKVEYVEDLESKCNFDLDTIPTPEEVVGEDGIIHYIYIVECPDCGFSVVLEEWTEVYSACEEEKFYNYKVSCGEEIIVEYTESDHSDNHQWEYSYEVLGDSCQDGVKVSAYCPICELTHEYTSYSHMECEWNVTIDLSEYTECGGSARVDRCKLCGEVTYLHDISFNCDFAEGVEEEILNENGEVCGSKVTFTCKNCGIIATQSEWIENESGCESYEYSQLQIFVDGKCVLEYLDEEYISNHQYEYTYEIEEGKTCEDGCKVTVKCTVCGYYYTYNTTHHNTQSETINFADYGACGGSASISRCMVCNTVTNCNLWENSDCDLETVTEDILDDNGEKLGTRTVQICSECGLTVIKETRPVFTEKCELILYSTTLISINGEVIVETSNELYLGGQHKYERTYEFDGEPNCLSEYTVIDTCTICGYESRWTGSGHMTEYFEHDLTEYGACKGYVSGYHCSICDQITELDDFDICYDINNPEFIEEKTDEDGNVHVIGRGTCPTCNLTFEIEQWMMQEDCLITGKALFSIYSRETLLYSFTFVQTEARHDIQYEYELLGKTCSDGVNVIETCSKCDYYYERTYWGHKTAWKYVELADYGLCGGYVELATCEFCEETVGVNWNTKCAWYYVETREDGWVIENCKRCGAERHYLVTDGEKDENCNYLHTETNVFYIDGVEVYRFTYSQNYGGHNWEYTYEFEGEPNCQSQYKIIETCTECGYSNWWYTSGHRTEWFEFNLSDYGACDGYISGELCTICGEIVHLSNYKPGCYIEKPDSTEEIIGDDGLVHIITRGECPDCGLTFTGDEWTVAESNCVYYVYSNVNIYAGETLIFDFTFDSQYDAHDYQRSYEFLGETCKDGIKVTEYCTKCDIYNEWTTYDHALEEEYIHLEEYGMCGGYVRVTKCVACDYQDSWYNNYCSWSYIGKNDGDLDVYECTNCGALRYTETVAGEKDENCNYYGTFNHTIYKDGVEIAKYSQSFGSSRHNIKEYYEMYGESCEDGWMYRRVCLDCGAVFEEGENNGHSMMIEVDIDLSGFCNSHELDVRHCPCTESLNYNFFGISYYSEYSAYYCEDCGLMITVDAVDDEANCKRTYHFNVGTYNGEEFVLVNEYVVDTVEHNYKVSFDMYGTSCEEGYKEIWTCMGCGDSYEGSEYYWHNSYRVENYDFSDYGACYGYYQRYTCPCGENAWEERNYCQDTYENIEGYDENGNYYTLYRTTCSTCGLVYESKTVSVENTENCTRTLIYTETVVIGENEFVLKSETSEYLNHSFKDVEYTVSNGVTTIVSVCETCGYSNRFESQQAVLEADENGDYYYDFIFTPEETGTYHIFGLGNTITWVNLYQLVDGELIQLKYDNAGGQDYNFYLSYTLTVGVTYVYRIDYLYENKEGIIDYCFEKLDSISCDHSNNRVFKFITDSENCHDGVRCIDFCEYCGRIEYIEERYGHINYNVYSYEINSSDCNVYHYLGVSNCPCGYEFSINTNLDWNEETQSYSCSECGLIASRITEWVEDGCVKYLVTKITVTQGEEELFSGEERIAYSNHNFSDIEYVENGEDVSIIYSCSKCDEFKTFEINQAVLEDNGAGEFYYDLTVIPEESDNYIISSMTSGDTYVILYQIIDGEYVEIGRNDDGGNNNNFYLTKWLEEGNTYVYRIRFLSSSKSGTINYVISQADSQHTQNSNLPCSHNSAYLVTLLPGSKNCNEGAFRVDVCTYCGYLHYFTSGNSHFTTQIERVDLEQIGACHGYFYIYSCACGAENGINLNNFCYDSYTRSDYPIKDENGNWVYSGVYSCSTCGLEVSYSYYDVRDHQTCQLIRYYNVTVSINGEVALTRHYEIAQTSHDYELSFNMYGKSCEDGYREIYTCADCGDSYEGNEYYHHNNYYIQATQPYMAWENPVHCPGESVSVYSCACGHEFYYNVWGMDWDSELQGYSCSECGLSVYETEEWVEDGCVRYLIDTIVVNFGDEEWYNDFRTVEYKNHNFINNEYVVNGDDKCIISTCDRCDETKTTEIKQADIAYQEDGHYYYDFTFTPEKDGEYTIMSIGDKNTYVVLYQLVDGELHRMSSNSWGGNNGNFKLSYRLEAGATYVYRISYNGVEESGTIDYIFESRVNNNLCNHSNVYFSQLIEGAETCNDGCYYGSICKYCADLSNIREVYDHNTVNKDYLDLDSLGACYGHYYFNSCACGENHNVYINSCYDSYENTSEYDENGNLVNIHTRSCSTCGLSYVSSYYTVKDRDNCKLHYYYTVTIMIGDELILEKEYEVAKTQHDYLASFEMYGETCYDGYLVTYTCSDCGDSYEYGESFYHNTYRVYTINTEELGCCEGHALYVEACPCGYYFNYYYDGLSNNAEDPERYYCDDCDLAFRYTYNDVYEGCSRSENKSISITFGDEELYSLEAVVNYFNHSFYDTSAEFIDGAYVINSVCTDCGETRSYSSERVVLTDEDSDGRYSYEFELSVDETKEYYFRFFDDNYKYVYIYRLADGEREYYYSSAGSNNFSVSPTLYAEDTYIVEIYEYTDEDVVVDFFMTEKYIYGANCSHGYLSFGCLLEGSETCEDGTLRGSICYQCGRITSIYKENYHNTYIKERIVLSDYGACYGEYILYECACGKEVSISDNASCAYHHTSGSHYDEEGKLIHVNTRTCFNCGLRFDTSYYTVKDRENCALIYYYTVSVTINDQLIVAKSYTRVEESHDYEITAEFMEGSTSCDQGVNVTRTCKDCGDTLTYSEYYHNQYVKETIDLEQFGSVCKGYVTVVGCVCGKYNDLYLDNVLCDFDEENCLLWIENVADKNQWDMSGYWRGFNNYAYIYTCAVTDPDQCAFKMRYATYWLKDEDSCVAYRYETYQFGYDEDTGACAYEITYKTGEYATYHDYVETNADGSTHYDCPDCGSYYYEDYYYYEDGNTSRYEKKILNTTGDGNDKYYELIREYDYDYNGSHYQSRDYEKRIYADDTEWYRERTWTPYVGTFGKPGWEVKSTSHDRYGYENEEHYAYVYLSGFASSGYEYSNWEYYIFQYYTDGANWQKYDYTYTFDGECIRTTVYTDNSGANETTVDNYCRTYRTESLEAPTCTQDGTYRHQCIICQRYSESYASNPIGHAWSEINNDWHYCIRCGLENANGADGTIIMSDLTEEYGNGENYVVGYWNQGNVKFTKYVSIILENGEEIILEGIEFSEIEGLRALVFSKAAVEAAATELGYSADEYLVRFAFVPYGADSTLDYAITFTETFDYENAPITDDMAFKQYIGAGEMISFTISPTEDTVWTFTSAGSYDTYGYLYDAAGNLLSSDDDSGEQANFLITYTLAEGETYTISVRWYHGDTSGYMPLIFDCTPVAQ